MKKLLVLLLAVFTLSLFVPELDAATAPTGVAQAKATKAKAKKKHRTQRHQKHRKHHRKQRRNHAAPANAPIKQGGQLQRPAAPHKAVTR